MLSSIRGSIDRHLKEWGLGVGVTTGSPDIPVMEICEVQVKVEWRSAQ